MKNSITQTTLYSIIAALILANVVINYRSGDRADKALDTIVEYVLENKDEHNTIMNGLKDGVVTDTVQNKAINANKKNITIIQKELKIGGL